MSEEAVTPDYAKEPETGAKIGYFDDTVVMIGKIPEAELTPAVTFRYMPMTSDDFITWFPKMDATIGKGDARHALRKEMVQKFLVQWDLKKPDGSDVNHRDLKELGRVPFNIIVKISEKIEESLGKFEDELKKSGPQSNS